MPTVVGRAWGGEAHAVGVSPHAWRTDFLTIVVAVGLLALPGAASAFHFSTGNPDGKMASGSRPPDSGKIEIESADDFILTDVTHIDHATFTGLVPAGGVATVAATGNSPRTLPASTHRSMPVRVIMSPRDSAPRATKSLS